MYVTNNVPKAVYEHSYECFSEKKIAPKESLEADDGTFVNVRSRSSFLQLDGLKNGLASFVVPMFTGGDKNYRQKSARRGEPAEDISRDSSYEATAPSAHCQTLSGKLFYSLILNHALGNANPDKIFFWNQSHTLGL